MTNHSFLRTAGLFALAGMISGCSLWSGPWPRMDYNTDGLGSSPIADYLRKDHWMIGGDVLERGLAKFIAEQTPAKGLSRQDAESLGMQCAPAPSTECTYSGELWYRVGSLPPHSPHYGKRTIQNIEVWFSYLKPQGLVVKVREHDVPDE